jgi:hypothetical protein
MPKIKAFHDPQLERCGYCHRTLANPCHDKDNARACPHYSRAALRNIEETGPCIT